MLTLENNIEIWKADGFLHIAHNFSWYSLHEDKFDNVKIFIEKNEEDEENSYCQVYFTAKDCVFFITVLKSQLGMVTSFFEKQFNKKIDL